MRDLTMKQLAAVDEVKRQIGLASGNINLADMALAMNYSEKYLARIFRQAENCSMKTYAMTIRMQTAMQLMCSGKQEQIYEDLGYYDQSHFDRDFRKYTGMTPRQYRLMKQDGED